MRYLIPIALIYTIAVAFLTHGDAAQTSVTLASGLSINSQLKGHLQKYESIVYEGHPIPNYNKYAFIIGVNSYEDDSFSPLTSSVFYATRISEKLQNIGFPKQNITLLISDPDAKKHPSKRNIESRLKYLQKELPEGALVVFYFVGYDLEAGSFSCIVPEDCDKSHASEGCIAINDVIDLLNSTKAQIKLMFVDSSRNMEHSPFGRKTLRLPTKELPAGFALIQSNSSYEKLEFTHRIFTETFLEALDGAANQNEDGSVTLEEILVYTQKETEKRAMVMSQDAKSPAICLDRLETLRYPLFSALPKEEPVTDEEDFD